MPDWRSPVCADGSKKPDVATWRAFITTRPTVADMRAWDFGSRAGFGVIGGAVSGHIDPWDFDDLDTYHQFMAAAHACGLGELVDRIRSGFEQETPKRGRRWLVRYPDSLPFDDVALARRPGRDEEPPIKTLIEITLFSILAPSNGPTHPSGRPYVHVSGGFDTIASYTADERAALMALARSFDQMPMREAGPTTSADRRTSRRPGDAFNTRATWTDVLPDWTEVYRRDDTIYLRRPAQGSRRERDDQPARHRSAARLHLEFGARRGHVVLQVWCVRGARSMAATIAAAAAALAAAGVRDAHTVTGDAVPDSRVPRSSRGSGSVCSRPAGCSGTTAGLPAAPCTWSRAAAARGRPRCCSTCCARRPGPAAGISGTRARSSTS